MKIADFNNELVAVVTGGAAGIGLAAASRFARQGLKVCIADIGIDRLYQAASLLAALAPGGAASIMAQETGVRSVDQLKTLKTLVCNRFGGTDILMNNAGIQPGSTMFGPPESWRHILDVNLWGVIINHEFDVDGAGMAEHQPGRIDTNVALQAFGNIAEK